MVGFTLYFWKQAASDVTDDKYPLMNFLFIIEGFDVTLQAWIDINFKCCLKASLNETSLESISSEYLDTLYNMFYIVLGRFTSVN